MREVMNSALTWLVVGAVLGLISAKLIALPFGVLVFGAFMFGAMFKGMANCS